MRTCGNCGYDLRGHEATTSTRCSECGTTLVAESRYQLRRRRKYHAHFLEDLPTQCVAVFLASAFLMLVMLGGEKSFLNLKWSAPLVGLPVLAWVVSCLRYGARLSWQHGWVIVLGLYHGTAVIGVLVLSVVVAPVLWLYSHYVRPGNNPVPLSTEMLAGLSILAATGVMSLLALRPLYRAINRRRNQVEYEFRNQLASNPERSRGLYDTAVPPVDRLANPLAIATVLLLFWAHPFMDGLGIATRLVATCVLLVPPLISTFLAKSPSQFGTSADWTRPRHLVLAIARQCGVLGIVLVGLICLAGRSLCAQYRREDLAIEQRATWTCVIAVIVGGFALSDLLTQAYRRADMRRRFRTPQEDGSTHPVPTSE